MFSRGNWAVIGIDPSTYPAFEQSLNDASLMLANSQLTASAIARINSIPAIGLNPFDRPRLDEVGTTHALNADGMTRLAEFASRKAEDRDDSVIDQLEIEELFRYGASGFRIAEGAKRFGFWLVYNDAKDVGDMASLKEHKAYTSAFKPYKFLSSGEKKAIETDAKAVTANSRKQYRVLVDFESGRAYIDATSKTTIFMLRHILALLGVETKYVAWSFHDSDWIRKFLAKVLEESRFKTEFRKRAEETTRFSQEQIERLEDAELERIVSDYFSMTQLETEEWVGLRSPAMIRLYPASNTVVATAPTTATLLLDSTDAAHVYGAPISIQERKTFTKKTGEERIYRDTVYTIDVTDGMNEVESGAALLRGFDLPSFKRAVQREIRKSKEIPTIARFWNDWLVGLEQSIQSFTTAVITVLEIDGSQASSVGIKPIHSADNDNVLG